MRNRVLKYFMLCIVMMATLACRHDDNMLGDDAVQGTAMILSVSTTQSSTRGVEDLNDDGTVSDLEAIAQGRKMYRLGVFLLENNVVVASTVLEQGDDRFFNDNTAASVKLVNLDYSKTYQLYAVANYGDYDSVEGNVGNITAGNITGSHKVTASSDNICDVAKPCPLSLKREVKLEPGVNNISGELKRTYARLRINVRNQSDVKDLTITGLQFPAKFTQSSADLFTEGGNANVSPVVTSQDAITPFTQNLVIPMIAASGATSEKTIFDAYLLESTGGDYKYTLNLKYAGDESTEYTVSSTVINKRENITDGKMYVLYNSTSGRYLYADATNKIVGTGPTHTNNGVLDNRFVWKLKKVYNNQYVVESMSSGYVMKSSAVTSSKIELTEKDGETNDTDYFTASNTGSGNNAYIRFASTSGNYYMAVSNNVACGHESNRNTNQRNFRLYEVTGTSTSTSITHSETIPIKILDNTGHTSPIDAIRRNDFIDVLVNVSYNDKTGEVQFEVSNWNEVDGDVTFD